MALSQHAAAESCESQRATDGLDPVIGDGTHEGRAFRHWQRASRKQGLARGGDSRDIEELLRRIPRLHVQD